MQELKIVELDIETLAKNGDGLAFYQDTKVEVSGAIVGDRVQVALRRKRKGCRKGKLLNIVQPSPHRIFPKCSHAHFCGGCNWQMLEYFLQLKEKEKIIHKLFSKFSEKIQPIIPAKKKWEYRNKMEFSFSTNKAETKFLGLIIARSQSYVFNLEECYLASPWMAQLVQRIRSFWETTSTSAYHPYKNEGFLKTLTLREGQNTQEKMIILTINDLAWDESFIKDFVHCVQEELKDVLHPYSIYVRKQKAIKGQPSVSRDVLLFGKEKIEEKIVLSFGQVCRFLIGPSSFFQPNPSQAEVIYSQAIEMIKEDLDDSVVYDLYSGTGTLGIVMAQFAKKVIGIEINPDAVKDAMENQKLNDISNFEIFSGDVEKVLLEEKLPHPDIVVLDPPREGLRPKALELVQKLGARKIVYISCNPYTQVHDVEELVANGYMVKNIQPIDQFPHTVHVENIVLLEKN